MMARINHRVRAIMMPERGKILLIKRVRPGVPPYYIIPGGGVESFDANFESALKREVSEEIGGEIEIMREIFTSESAGRDRMQGWTIRHHFYLCRLLRYDVSQRHGPEFNDPARGEYLLEVFPVTEAALEPITLLPTELKSYLLNNLTYLETSL